MVKPQKQNGPRNSQRNNPFGKFKRRKPKQELEVKTDEQGRKPYINAYKRAEFAYQKIQAERKEQAALKQKERELQQQKREEYESLRKKMNKALKQKTRKGQPKLGAQMEVMLEKLQRKIQKEEEDK